MNQEVLLAKIRELLTTIPVGGGINFGKKAVGGKYTDEDCIVFNVEKKKPLSELSKDEILPKSIKIGNKVYKTDVRQRGKIRLLNNCDTCDDCPDKDDYCPGCGEEACIECTLADSINCSATVMNNCYKWMGYPYRVTPNNNRMIRPLKGGAKIVPEYSIEYVPNGAKYSYGTLGFIAIDDMTSALVGITNNHVVVKNAFYTSYRNVNGPINSAVDSNVYQPFIEERELNGIYTPILYPTTLYPPIGKVLRYVPIIPTGYGLNRVDAAMISLDSSVINFNESFKQVDLSWNFPMPFASDGEINALTSSTPIYSTGARSGAKVWGTPCELHIVGSPAGIAGAVVGYNNDGTNIRVTFENLIELERRDIDGNYDECPCPIAAGDSGSALIANIGGAWKIIGLLFAGGTNSGMASRITEVASQLGISAWMGENRPFVNLNSQQIITLPSQSALKTLDCPSGKTYWQIGNTNISQPCNV